MLGWVGVGEVVTWSTRMVDSHVGVDRINIRVWMEMRGAMKRKVVRGLEEMKLVKQLRCL